MTGVHRTCVVALLVAGVIACNTQFKKDTDADVDDAFDVSTEGSPDGTPDGGGECGDGEPDEGEQCDDGNEINGDGCDNDCTYSCAGDDDCLDENVCNGAEFCDGDAHACEAGMALDDGHLLEVGPPRIICLEGNPAESACGDGFVDEGGGEFCEPPGEGLCTEDCRLGCSSDEDCPDDGVFCNGEEYCSESVCDRRDVPSSGTACNDGLYCTTDEVCDGAGTCTGGDPTCVDDLDCTDNRCDETGDSCSYPLIAGNCLMGGVCFADHDRNPENDCEECDSARELSLWLAVSDGTACADDGASCTDDECASGACGHPVLSGWCYMGGACITDGTRDSGNACLVCDHGSDPGGWTPDVGYACDDGIYCTDGDACDSTGACTGSTVSWLEGASQITGGYSHSCAIVDTVRARCWGNGAGGQLGHRLWTDTNAAVDVYGLTSGASQIEAGWYHTCAVTSTGGVKCWGQGTNGQLGNAAWSNRNSPVDVSGLTSVREVCGGAYHSCAVLASGQVRCWGQNYEGQLGNGSWGSGTDRSTPVTVLDPGGASLIGATAITCGAYHTCALRGSGSVSCWGTNTYGELGTGTTSTDPIPYAMTVVAGPGLMGPLIGVSQFSAGWSHTCALTSPTIVCWGRNHQGQLGNGYTSTSPAPVSVQSGSPPSIIRVFEEVGAGGHHACARTSSGGAKCWGRGEDGELGYGGSGSGLYSAWAVDVVRDGTGTPLANVKDVACGVQHSLAIVNTGSLVKGWGANDHGQLGLGTVTSAEIYPLSLICGY